ncbi:MAG: DTW domain-containing protein [Planctomycetales bacterium]|nr:DTW domain-containing protein [Planctomycetales bacterium]
MRSFLSPHRCPGCEIRRPLCFCDLIPQLAIQTRIIILMHTSEEVLTTNTARLAVKALTNSELRIHSRKNDRLWANDLVHSERPSLLLYPSPRSVELTAEFVSRLPGPVNLIVPDANWRQTTKFVRREPSLIGIPPVRLPQGAPSEYRLRTQRNDKNLCTLEAIARAIGILECRETQASLENLLRILVERTLWSRGMLSASECVTTHIPEAAFSQPIPFPSRLKGRTK